MFGEKFLNSFKMVNSKKVQEAEVIHEKGSLQNPYSSAEFQALKRERLREEQMMHFDGYIKDPNDQQNLNAKYLNFVEKDSNNYTVNLSPSQRRTYTCLNTIKNEQGLPVSKLSFFVKDGILNKKLILEIGHNLPLRVKKEIVDTIYKKLDEKQITSNYAKWSEEAKAIKEAECREDFLFTVAGIIRKNIDIPDDGLVDVKILQ